MTDTPKLVDIYQSLINDISENAKHLPLVHFISSKVNRKSGQILLIFLVIVTILTAIGFLGHYFTIFIACLLGASRTLMAEQSGSINEKQQWLTYWLMIGIIITVESVFGGILLVVPFYDIAKLLVIVSMAYPKTNLADRIHHYVIRPRLPIAEEELKEA